MSTSILGMLLADARMPTGGHTQSGGLEAAVMSAWDPGLTSTEPTESLRRYALARLHTVVRVEAGSAVVARALSLAGEDPHAVAPHWAARTSSAALRAASRRQGRGWSRTVTRIWPDLSEHLDPGAETARAIVLGCLAARTGMSAPDLARLVAYDDVACITSAALKVAPLDPVDATAIVVALTPAMEDVVSGVSSLTRPDDIPAAAAPLIDQLGERHADERKRLFHA